MREIVLEEHFIKWLFRPLTTEKAPVVAFCLIRQCTLYFLPMYAVIFLSSTSWLVNYFLLQSLPIQEIKSCLFHAS